MRRIHTGDGKTRGLKYAANFDFRAYQKSTVKPKAICIINPGNPTGQVADYENIKKVLEFAYQRRLFVLADEVYQDNIYAEGAAFHSFRKVSFFGFSQS